MVHLMIALVLVGPTKRPERPTEMSRCLISCKNQYQDGVQRCWFDPAPKCEQVCEDSAKRKCLPRVVVLGNWTPMPKDYAPAEYDWNTYPVSTFESHLNDPAPEESPTYTFTGSFRHSLVAP